MSSDQVLVHLPQGIDLRLSRRHALRLTGKELVEVAWRLYPDVKQTDRQYWALRAHHSNPDEAAVWVVPDKKLQDQAPQVKQAHSFHFCPRIYPDGWHQLASATVVELLFHSIKRQIYDEELKLTDKARDMLAGYALQAYVGNYRSEQESRSALRRYYLVKIGRDLEYWAESERRAVNQHRKLVQLSRGKAITGYIRVAQEQPTYGIQYHRGITDKTERQWVIGVCYHGLHRYQPGILEEPERKFGWKQLENLYYRDRKFSVEVASDQAHGGVKQYSWYGPTKVIKALWHAAIHAHQFYLARRQGKGTSSAHFQARTADIESRLDQGTRLASEEKHPDHDVHVQLAERFDESPETRARELEAMMSLKEKKKELENQYFQRVEQLKQNLKKEAELTGVIPSELRKYQTADDDQWEAEMKSKKQIKNIQQTTFKSPVDSSPKLDTPIVTTRTKKSADHAREELRRVERDLEINTKIAECLAKLNRHKSRKTDEKRKYVKRHQEQLFKKYEKKIESLRETKHSLEQLVQKGGYVSRSFYMDDLAKSIQTSTSNSSSSLNIEPERVNHSSSGAATPTSNQSTSSLLDDSDNPPPYSSLSSNSNLTRQYSLRNSREGNGPVVTTREDDIDDPPPVTVRTTSLTPNLPRRVSQPLVDISAENITLRTKPKEPKSNAPLKPDHQRIQITSQKQIESRYCRKHRDLRKQTTSSSAVADNTNSNSNIALDTVDGYFHQGYGVMPKYPTPLDTLSESSFASDSPHFQNKVQIRQLLKDHFREHIREHQKRSVPTLARIPRSRSNTSSAHQSADSAFGTDIDFDNAKSAPSTPGSSKRQIPTTLSLNKIQSYQDPGTPTSIASGSTGFQSSLQSSTSLSALGNSLDQNLDQMATRRKEVRPDVLGTNTTGLRLALRRVHSQESALDHHHQVPLEPPASADPWMLEERGTLV